MGKGISPTYEEVMQACESLAQSHRECVKLEEIGRSEEGRPIPLLKITDSSVPQSAKPIFFVTGGLHGSEEAGRAVTIAFAQWLTEPQNKTHLERQLFLIAPCVNPDGAIRDIYHNAKDVNVGRAFPVYAEPLSSEARAAWDVARKYTPDAVIDCHGLAGGSMGDGEHIYTGYGTNFCLKAIMSVVEEMDHAAELAGFPQREPGLQDYRTAPPDTLPRRSLFELHSFGFVVETTEGYYPIGESARSGLVRLAKFVEMGERIHFFQPYPNYPCDVVTGDSMGALMPYGGDYDIRRKNRALATKMIYEGVPFFGRDAYDKGHVARVTMPVEEKVKTFPQGIVVQLTIDRRAVAKEVCWNGRRLEKDKPGNGWSVRAQFNGIVVRAEIPEPPKHGKNVLEVVYDAPFKPHVNPE